MGYAGIGLEEYWWKYASVYGAYSRCGVLWSMLTGWESREYGMSLLVIGIKGLADEGHIGYSILSANHTANGAR